MSEEYVLVKIELKRIQTFLLEIPRLRTMVGANALMGETLRGRWRGHSFTSSSTKSENSSESPPKSLPELAERLGAAAPPEPLGEKFELHGDDEGRFSISNEGDDPVYQDDPYEVARRTGVFSRDGGHFEALFSSAENAETFKKEARRLLWRQLPGLQFELSARAFSNKEGRLRSSGKPHPLVKSPDDTGSRDLLDIPHSFVCQLSGQEMARDAEPLRRETGGIEEIRRAGVGAKLRLDRGKAFDEGRTTDVLGILRDPLLAELAEEAQELRFPRDLHDLSATGYLAVIHADGNGVGKRYRDLELNETDSWLAAWHSRERFFYSLRAGMRVATLRAMTLAFRTTAAVAPVRPLMLGGDDLLLVCDASRALSFAVELAKAVHSATGSVPLKEGKQAPLSLGMGVAIVQANFPFHRAHALAESLAESAKRISKSEDGAGVSTVDWVLVTESWHDDVLLTRARDASFQQDGGSWALSAKPYPIRREDAPAGGKSLEDLLEDARHPSAPWREGGIARSQLKGLARSLESGRYAGRFAIEAMPGPYRATLQKLGYVDGSCDPWTEVEGGGVCRLLDLVEVAELLRGDHGGAPAPTREPVGAASSTGERS